MCGQSAIMALPLLLQVVQRTDTYCWWTGESLLNSWRHLVTFSVAVSHHIYPVAVCSCVQSILLPGSSAVLWWWSSALGATFTASTGFSTIF